MSRSKVMVVTLAAMSVMGATASLSNAIPLQLKAVAVSGQASPDGGTFQSFTVPAINAGGDVAFQSYLTDPGSGSFLPTGLFLATNGTTLVKVARDPNPAPGTTANFSGAFNFPNLNDAGHVAFRPTLEGGDSTNTNNSAIYAGGPRSLTLVARENWASPASPTTYRGLSTSTPFGLPLFGGTTAGGDRIAFTALLSGAGVTVNNSVALIGGSPSAPAVLARAGDPAPGEPTGVNYGGSFTTSVYPALSPVMNGNGQVLFRSDLRDANNGQTIIGTALFTGSTQSNMTQLARSGASAPFVGAGVTFSAPATNLAINNAGSIAFAATLNGASVSDANDGVLYVGSTTAGAQQVVFREGDAARGVSPGVKYAEVSASDNLVMNASGHVLFNARLSGGDVTGSFNDEALFAGAPGNVNAIARTGDIAPDTNGEAQYLNFFGAAYNDRDQAVFVATLTGDTVNGTNSTGLFGYDPVQGDVLILRNGDPLEVSPGVTKTVRSFVFNDKSGGQDGRIVSLNDDGLYTFAVDFTDNTSGVYTSTGFASVSVPEPTMIAALMGAASFVRVRRRRRAR